MKDYQFFSAKELQCKCGKCDGGEMNQEFMAGIVELRQIVDFPFIVTSAYRCSEYNDQLYVDKGAKKGTHLHGPHTTGKAMDILVSRMRARLILDYSGDFDGIGLNQKGDDRFIHLDYVSRPERALWSY